MRTVNLFTLVLALVLKQGCAAPTDMRNQRGTTTGSAVMTANKKTIEKYMDGFRAGDHPMVLACLTEDVEWEMPGAFHLFGKAAFDSEIENDAFVGRPRITVGRLTEENDVVIAEGAVEAQRKGGGVLYAVFCDVFEMRDAKIRKLTTYLMERKGF